MPLSELELLDLKASNPRYQPNLWAKVAFWDPDEIAALSLGYDPTDAGLDSYTGPNWAGRLEELAHRKRAARRAAKIGQISKKCSPNDAIEWMNKYDIVFPDALKAAVNEYYPITERERVNAEVTRHLVFLVKKLRAELAEARTSLPEVDEDIPPKTKASYEKIIAAMAHGGYGHDPAVKRSDTPTSVSSDMAELGLELSQPVISKHIRDACRNQGFDKRP